MEISLSMLQNKNTIEDLIKRYNEINQKSVNIGNSVLDYIYTLECDVLLKGIIEHFEFEILLYKEKKIAIKNKIDEYKQDHQISKYFAN